MHIYHLSYLLIPIIIFVFIYYPSKTLLYFTIFFIPFTSTALFSLGSSIESGKGVPLPFILSILYIIKSYITFLGKGKIPVGQIKTSFYLVIAFSITVIASLTMPLIINGKINVLDRYVATIMYSPDVPLFFRTENITQSIYMILGLIFCVTLSMELNNINKLQKAVKIYLLSCVFMSFWGLIEWSAYFLPYDYPGIFNQLGVSGTQGTLTLYSMPRISSVALEASAFSKELLLALPFLAWSTYSKNYLFNKLKDKIILMLFVIVLALSLSSTAYVGLISIIIIFGFITINSGKLRSPLVLPAMGLILTALILAPMFFDYGIQKIDSFSGVERLKTVTYAIKYFKQYPLLGIGWGSFPTYDLVFNILVGVGIVGFSLFFSWFFYIFNYSRKYYQIDRKSLLKDKNSILSTTILNLFILIVIISQISGLDYYNQFYWLMLGVILSYINIRKTKELIKPD